MKTKHTIKIFALLLLTALMGVSVTVWAEDVTPSVTLTTYYSAANGKTSDALRTALQGIIDNHTVVSYNSLGTLMQYSDTEEANGTDVIDIYTTCTYSVTGALTWIGSGDVGDGMNREHTAPQSWFNEATPMVSDAFHIFPTDAKANNNRSSYLYGEFSGTGRSYSTSKCTESGKLSNGDSGKKTITSYTYQGTTYSPTASYTGIVYEPADEYKGDIARGYFYLATRYADKCSSWSGGAFGSDNNGFNNYTAELMLKWHRQDPVSRKELIRNEVIYGNTKYNKSDKKQGNRNPFIDYPELVEYIWGNKKGQNVTITALTSAYDEAGSGTPTTTYNVTLWRNGNTQVVSGLSSTYTLPTTGEDDACANWVFDGWSTTNVTSTNTKPNYVTSVSSASTVYAVYAKTAENNAPSRKTKMATSTVASVTFSDANSDSSTDKASSSSISDLVASESGISSYSGTKVYAGTTGAKIGASGTAGSITLTLSSAANVKSVVVNAKKYGSDTGILSVTAGSTSVGSAQSPPETAGDLTFTAETAVSNTTTITVSTSAKRAYIKSITVIAEGGGSTSTTTYASEPEECKCSGNLGTPAVTATPSDGTITLTWPDVTDATNGYTVTISKGVGYTTECGDTEIGEVTNANGTNTCVITGLVNGLSYTTSVVANATATICESAADEDTTTPVGCSSWDVTFGYSTYSLTAGGTTVAPTITGTTHGAVTYTSSNEAVLTVNASGVVTPVGAGTATVTASWAGADGYCAKDIVSDLFTVTGSLTITYNANYGETPATATQTVTYNVAATLAANTFSRTGYTFFGWATEPNGDKVYNDQQASVVFTEATTLYAVWQINSHNVTFTPAPTGATVTVNSKSTSPVSNVNYGTTVTIDVTPAAHYSLNAITLSTGGEVAIDGNRGSFMMPDEDVTVTVTMIEETKYTVNWYVVGTPTAETNYAGETLVGLNAPAIDCNGKVFVGWTATAAYNSDDAPADLFTDAGTKTMPSNNSTNYYAVFATATTTNGGGTSSVVDELTLTSTGVSSGSTTYSEWSGVSGTSGAVYAGQSAGGNNSIQLRSRNSNSGIITTTSGGKVTKVAVTWYDGSTIDIYGKNAAYTDATDLYGDAAGTLLGSIVKGTSTELTITGDYEYIGIRSNNGAVYLTSVSITWTTTGGGSTTTYSGYTTSCEAPEEVTITFNANDGSQTPATTTQTIDYNTAATLAANTFARTGYTFLGWNTQADGNGTTYADKADVTLTSNITLFAIWQINSHNVSYTLTPSDKATVQVNGSATTPQSFEYGTSVTVTIAPEEAYEITSVTATGVTLDGSGDTRTFTMPDNDVAITITLTAKPTHTVTWSANGTTTTATYYAGQEIVFPESAEGCEGKEFVGWSASTVALTDDAPELVTSATMGDNDLTFYAVFATVTTTNGGGTSSVVDELTLASTGVSSGSSTYSEWSGVSGTSGAVYAGQSAGGNSSIQLRTTNSNSGIITTTSGGKATKVTIDWNSNTSNGRTLNVYGKNTAYESASDLYGNNSGTLIGTIVYGTSTELTITDEYEYLGLRSANSAMYLDKVSITWTTTGGGSTTTYSGYTTSCETPTEVIVTFNANCGEQPATATQTIDYNTAATLTANAFARTGYTFTGWNTQADGNGTTYADKAEVTLTVNTILYAQWSKNSYEVAFSTPTGATAVTVNSSSSSPQTVEFEATVTVTVTPDETHIVSGVSVTGDLAVTDNGDNTYTFTMPANNVTVMVTMEAKPTYTIRFYDNGVKISEQAIISGQAAVAPEDPEDCGDNTFAGWWTDELAANNTTSYTWIQDFTATQDQDYYAVYSRSETSSEGGGTSKYTKVTATSDISDGQYLIVYENESGSVAFDGGLDKLDAASNTIDVTISNDEIAISDATTAAEFTINASAGTILSASGKYIGQTSDANGLVAQDEALSNTITIEEGVTNIVSGGAYLRYNSASNQLRFRYYKSASYTNQQAIQLYKKTSGGSTTYYTTAPDCTIPEVTTNVMLVTELYGATIAVKPVVSNNQAAAAPLLNVGDKYYHTSAISGAADITWQLVERKGSYYIKDASGNYLTVDGDNLSLAAEPFTWFTSEGRFVTESGLGLCYSATAEAFVVSTDISASIQQIDVISLEGEAQLFTREFTQVDYYATLCLPYAVAPPFIEGVTVYNVAGKNVKDDKITGIVLAEETGVLNAGQPYVILSTTTELNVWYAADMNMVDEPVEAVGLVGNLSEEKLPVPLYCYGLKDNQLRRVVSEGPTVGQYKAYFDLSKVPNADTLPMSPSYKTMRTDADDVETAIDDLFGNPATINWNEPVYNVLGQRVGKDAVGVLIQNGMKFLIP